MNQIVDTKIDSYLLSQLDVIWYLLDTEDEYKKPCVSRRDIKSLIDTNKNLDISEIWEIIDDDSHSCELEGLHYGKSIDDAYDHAKKHSAGYKQLTVESFFNASSSELSKELFLITERDLSEAFATDTSGTHENTTTPLEEVIKTKYTSGHCMFLAIALNRLYGYEIAAYVDDCKIEQRPYIAHSYAITNCGKEVDIYGYQHSVDQRPGSKVRKGMTESDLKELFCGEPISNQDYEDAIQDAIDVVRSMHDVFDPIKNGIEKGN